MSKNQSANKKVIKATWDASAGLAIGSHSPNSGAIVLPEGALVTDVYFRVPTTFTSATDAGTIAMGYTGATGAFRAAIAISAAGNIYDEGTSSGLVGNQALDGNALTAIAAAAAKAATYAYTAVDVNLLLTVAVEALTAGKIVAFIEYVQTGDIS